MKIHRLVSALCLLVAAFTGDVSAQTTGSTVMIRVTDTASNVIPDVPVIYTDMYGQPRKADPMLDGSCAAYQVRGKLRFSVGNYPNNQEMIELAEVLPHESRIYMQVKLDGRGNAKVFFPRQSKAAMVAGMPQGLNISSVVNGGSLSTPQGGGVAATEVEPSGDCADATHISGEGVFGFGTVSDTDGPEHPECNLYDTDQLWNDVWYCWTAPCTGLAEIETLSILFGDPRIAVYDGCACPPTTLLACDDDSGFIHDARVKIPVIEGNQYLVRIGDAGSGLFGLPVAFGGVTFKCTPHPDNDDCENAEVVAVPSVTAGTTNGASEDPGAVSCGGYDVEGPGVWYTFTGTGNEITLSTCDLNGGGNHPFDDLFHHDFDSVISVYCGPCDDLQCVAADDDGCNTCLDVVPLDGFPHHNDCDEDLGASVTFCSEYGATYRVLVHGFGCETGDFDLTITDGDPCDEPIACIGACCGDNSCTVEDYSDCDAAGGEFQGDDTDCCGTGVYAIDEEQIVVTLGGGGAGAGGGGGCTDSFEDITATGNALVLFDDDGMVVPLGFVFDFYGEGKSEVGVTSNGYLTFGGDLTEFFNAPIPTMAEPNDVIAPLWDDLNPQQGGTVHYETLGSPGDRRFTAQWTGVPQFLSMDFNTFQAVLYEADNSIEFRYLTVTTEAFAGDYTIGIENKAGTNGLEIPGADIGSGNTCIRIVKVHAPLCDCEGLYLGDEDKVKFSELDGGEYDTDGESNGVLRLCGLDMEGNSEIDIDVDHAQFDVFGEVNMKDIARIVDKTPSHAATICIDSCGDVNLSGDARIRANGNDYGGTVKICSKKNIAICDTAHVEAEANYMITGNEHGGDIHLQARYTVQLKDAWTYASVKGPKAGNVYIVACGGHEDAVKIEGDINANGWGASGCGGHVDIKARQGGVYLAFNAIGAVGAAQNGVIDIYTALGIFPHDPPFTNPDVASVSVGSDYTPCECFEEDEEEEEPEEPEEPVEEPEEPEEPEHP